jgi:hypothetical protein
LIGINAGTPEAAMICGHEMAISSQDGRQGMGGRQGRWAARSRGLVGFLGAASLGALVAAGIAVAKEPWEQVLAQQLDLEQKCILTNTYNVQEWQLGDAMVISGKARCYDGREFDFSQKKNHLKFDIKACEPTVC